MNDAIGRADMEGLREDIRELTKAVMTVATVLYAGMKEQGGLSCLSDARHEVEYVHRLVNER